MINIKNYLGKIFEHYAKVFLHRNPQIKLVIVVGSIGKTSTKEAIATVLGEKFKIRRSYGNQNSMFAVPFGILDIEYPDSRKLRSVRTMLGIIWQFFWKSHQLSETEVIVQEIGTDNPGEVPHAGRYLHADIAVVTAVTPEHMEGFKTMEAVAAEELSAAGFADQLIINTDNTPAEYLKDLDFLPYSPLSVPAPQLLGQHSQMAVRGAISVAKLLGMSKAEIASGVAKIQPVNGRMRLFEGFGDTKLIDDTYNASPEAVLAALQTLYDFKAPQRIAVLGQMNEMGDESPEIHAEIGRAIAADKVDILVTVGENANKFLAPAALGKASSGSSGKASGATPKLVQVFQASSSVEAGNFVKENAMRGAVILFKGSQSGVFLEEAVKIMLANPTDAKNLVRQSAVWMRKKKLADATATAATLAAKSQ